MAYDYWQLKFEIGSEEEGGGCRGFGDSGKLEWDLNVHTIPLLLWQEMISWWITILRRQACQQGRQELKNEKSKKEQRWDVRSG